MTKKIIFRQYKVKRQSNSKNSYNNRNDLTFEEKIQYFLKTRIYNCDMKFERDNLKDINYCKVEGKWGI